MMSVIKTKLNLLVSCLEQLTNAPKVRFVEHPQMIGLQALDGLTYGKMLYSDKMLGMPLSVILQQYGALKYLNVLCEQKPGFH